MTDRPVSVVPTRNAAEGFAALLALDPQMDAATNVDPMTEAGRAIQSLVVTEAVRDAKIGGRKVKRGQTIALDPDDGLIAVDSDRDKAVLTAMQALKPGSELVTVFYGDGADLAEAEAIARKIGGGHAGRRDRGPARRPALLPVPDLGGIGRAMARPATARKASAPALPPPPTDPVELLDTPLARSGLAAGEPAPSGRHPARLLHGPRPAVPPAAAVRRPARDAGHPRPVHGAGRHGRVGPGDGRGRARRARLSGPHPAHDRPARGRHRQHRCDVVRSPLHRAPAAGRRRGRGVRKGQAFRAQADPRQPRVPGPHRRGSRCSTPAGSCRSIR